MYLGPIKFKSIETPVSEQYQSTHTFARVKPAVGKPILQDKGEGLTELSLGMYFHTSFCNPGSNISQLHTMKKESQVCPYFWDNGEFKGNFYIEKIGVVAEKRLPDGALLSASVDIALIECSEAQFLKSVESENATPEPLTPESYIEDELEEEIATYTEESMSDIARRP